MKRIFGIDIGGTDTKIGLFEEDRLLKKETVSTICHRGTTACLQNSVAAMSGILNGLGLSFSDIHAIGVGVPGPVDKDGVVHGCVNLGWQIEPVRDIMSRLCGGTAVIVENDANTAGLGELWLGAGAGRESMIFITLGTGVGGALIKDKRLITGAHGCAGEIGHITVNPFEKQQCTCKSYGCLEQYASATGMVRQAEELIAKGDKTPLSPEDITAKKIFDFAKNGDTLCLEVVDNTARLLALAIGSITAVFDPECVVIGGGVSNAGDFLLSKIKGYYPQFAFADTVNTKILLSSLKNDAGICGAAFLALQAAKVC